MRQDRCACRTSIFRCWTVPRDAPVDDADAYLRAAIAWHFGEATGSVFWLRAAKDLGFDPLADINTFDDLRRFPNLVNALRSVPVEDLIPRGYGSPPPVPQIFESGGTTGRSEADCPTAGLGRAGRPVADRRLHRRRLCTGPRLSVSDAERATRGELLLAADL